MHTIKNLCSLVASAALFAAAGCVTTDPNAVEADFGNSVRHMRQAQIANPSSPVDNDPIDHGDGQRINGAIDVYRKSVGNPAAVKEDLAIGIDD